MIRLYGAATGNCRRAAIALAEGGISFSCITLDLSRHQHKTQAFRSLNPRGLVPVLVEEFDGKPDLILTQSNAIMLYAARRSRTTLFDMAPNSETFFERLFFFLTEVITPAGDAFVLRRNGENLGADLLASRSISALKTAEQFLSASEFMCGSSFTLVDIAAYTSLFSVSGNVDWSSLPLLEAWFRSTGGRPGVTRGMRMFE